MIFSRHLLWTQCMVRWMCHHIQSLYIVPWVISSIVFPIVFEPSYNQEWLRVSNCGLRENVGKKHVYDIYIISHVPDTSCDVRLILCQLDISWSPLGRGKSQFWKCPHMIRCSQVFWGNVSTNYWCKRAQPTAGSASLGRVVLGESWKWSWESELVGISLQVLLSLLPPGFCPVFLPRLPLMVDYGLVYILPITPSFQTASAHGVLSQQYKTNYGMDIRNK